MENDSTGMEDFVASETEVAFDYIKASAFRTIWADGVIGGVTPKGLVHIAPYSERHAIPRRVVHSIEQVEGNRGVLSAEIVGKRISRNSIVREMQVDIMLGVDEAEAIAKWLLERVEEIRGGQST